MEDLMGLRKVGGKDIESHKLQSEINLEKVLVMHRNKVELDLMNHTELISLLPLINVVIPLEFKETAYTRSLSVQEREALTFKLLLGLALKYLKTSSTYLIILEDSQWMDPSSLQLLQSLIGKEINALFVVSLRTPCYRDSYLGLKNIATSVVTINPLSRNAICKLICTVLKVQHLGARLSDFIFNVGEGHPFFSVCLALGNRSAGKIFPFSSH